MVYEIPVPKKVGVGAVIGSIMAAASVLPAPPPNIGPPSLNELPLAAPPAGEPEF